MVKNEQHVFQKNWKEISDEESIKQLEYLLEHYKEYNIYNLSEDHIMIDDFSLWKSGFGSINYVYYVVNMQKVYSSLDKQFPLLEKLLDVCKQEAIIQQQAKQKKRKWKNIRFHVSILTIIFILGAASVKLLKEIEREIQEKTKKEKIINDQVKQYERTLPYYKEYKETQVLIQNYRDSLTRASR